MSPTGSSSSCARQASASTCRRTSSPSAAAGPCSRSRRARAAGPGPRPRLLRLRPDALRRALRDRRAHEPAVRGRGRRARGGRAHPARAVRRVSPRWRPHSRSPSRPPAGSTWRCARHRLAALARRARRALGRRAAARRPTPAARPGDGGADRSRPRRAARGRDQRAEHRRQDRRPEDARAGRAAAPVPDCDRRREAAALPVFDAVLADIGDAQSIEMSLSTFSGHVRNLVAILTAATERSLVLLDEVAAGTDPVEGSALAQALLERLAAQARLTRRDDALRRAEGVGEHDRGVANAATGFDPDTHAPIYRSSSAGRGSRTRCRSPSASGSTRASSATHAHGSSPSACGSRSCSRRPRPPSATPRRARGRGARARPTPRSYARRVRAREEELEAAVESVRASAAAEREQAADEARRDLSAARRRARRAARARSARPGSAAPRRAGARPTPRRGLRARARGRSARSAPSTSRCPTPGRSPSAIRSRRRLSACTARSPRSTGTRPRWSGRPVTALRVPLARLRPDGSASPRPRHRSASSSPRAPDVSDELDVRGQRRTRRARPSGRSSTTPPSPGCRSVRVIHGRGTGAVRTAVRDELDRHPLVDTRESDSADGATVVHLNG